MAINTSVSISWEVTTGNEKWANVMDKGMGATQVTGGSIELPQGGTAPSHAAVTGGTFYEAAEPGSGFLENIDKKLQTLIAESVNDELLNGGDGSGIEQFATAIAQNEATVASSEYMDNPNEAAATSDVINSIHVSVSISPSFSEVMEVMTEEAKKQILNELGRALS